MSERNIFLYPIVKVHIYIIYQKLGLSTIFFEIFLAMYKRMHIACGISQISQGWRIICRFLRHKELRHIYAFERQELHLLVDAVGVACETAARADDAVAGDDD